MTTPETPELSVILGTYNRRKLLEDCVAGIRKAVGGVTYEILVVDGGSTDGSREWLVTQPDVVFIGERQLNGAVVAFNQAFTLAVGSFVATLNDDCLPEPGILDAGVKCLLDDPAIGQVGFETNPPKRAWGVGVVHGLTYANFGVIRTGLAKRIARICGGLWAPVYRTYSADGELSCWVWRLGYRVQPLLGQRVINLPAWDALRERNKFTAPREERLFRERWPSAAHITGGLLPHVDAATLTRLREALSVSETRPDPQPPEG